MTATDPTPAVTGVPFVLNGTPCEANEGELLIDAAERNGVHIPRFCYHPRMTPVGMCRMCLVEVDGGRGPSLQPSCMLPVTPDMKVNTEVESAKAAQDGVLELLLINHPLDCPVCDKGGECPLQDNAYAYGPGESRFVEEKRHYEKPIPISDLVYLDRERCILCDRCTRFSKEVAGDPLIHFIGRGADTQVNTFPDHPFSSYFSGNTVQICPVGALTAEPYRFKARPWDLAENESTSTVDASGARVVMQSSRDRLLRVLGVDSDAVNWSWLSDKERFAYEATNSDERLRVPLTRTSNGADLEPTRWASAAKTVAAAIEADPDRVGVLGGARLPVEGQYAWSKLLRSVAGVTNIDAQLSDGLPDRAILAMPRATIAETVAPGGVIVLLGADPKEELPTLFLRLRHAAEFDGASIIEITPTATSLLPHAAASLRPLPGNAGVVADAIATGDLNRSIPGVNPAALAKAGELITSGRPVTVVLGRANLAEDASFALAAVEHLRKAAPHLKVLPALRRGNIMGALELGLTPGVDTRGDALVEPGLDADAMLRRCCERCHQDPRPARGRPARRPPQPSAGRGSLRQRRDHHLGRSLPDRVVEPSAGRASRRGLRRGRRQFRQHRGAHQSAPGEGHAAGPSTRRLDDRHRSGSSHGRRPRFRHARRVAGRPHGQRALLCRSRFRRSPDCRRRTVARYRPRLDRAICRIGRRARRRRLRSPTGD